MISISDPVYCRVNGGPAQEGFIVDIIHKPDGTVDHYRVQVGEEIVDATPDQVDKRDNW